MNKKINPNILNKNDFCNLHGHSTYSIGDAVGKASEIIDSVIENGMNSVAITDHGNMNVVADAYLYSKKINAKKSKFKYIVGNEMYFLPSINEWNQFRSGEKSVKDGEKIEIPDDEQDIEIEQNIDKILDQIKKPKEEEEEGLDEAIVENEQESKLFKYDPINRRHHLVVLAQNEEGLKNLYRLNGFSQSEGFYKKPRIDYDILKKHSNGLVVTSACLAGIMRWNVARAKSQNKSDEQIINDLENEVGRFDEIFNRDLSGTPRFFIEIQFNKIKDQHELNKYLVLLHRKTKIPLVAAADYHYPKRELFRARDLIKYSAQYKNKNYNMTIHNSIDELECELFPKNAQEMIEAYNEYDGNDYITEEELITAIKNSKYIADELIQDYEIDTSPKLPKLSKGNSQQTLEDLAYNKFKLYSKAGKIPKDKIDIYANRLLYELSVIKEKRFADYFITYEIIMKNIKEEMLAGLARGSAGGSLLAYVLGITELDPIKYGLIFERFLDEHRVIVYPRMDIF